MGEDLAAEVRSVTVSEPMVDPNAMPEPGRDAWMAVGLTTLVFFLVVIDVAAVNVAFPSIRDDFEVSDATLGWVISGYNITVASLLMVAGRYADSLGRKRLFLPGVAIFLLGSMLSGLAPSAGLLIVARVVQGVGGAIISPTAIAVVLPAFQAHKRSTVIGITGATGALDAVAGPALGVFVTDAWPWRGISHQRAALSHRADDCSEAADRVQGSGRNRSC